MICVFPDPYPEELFYSVLARFAERLDFAASTHAAEALYGSPFTSTEIEFPQRLNVLLSRLPKTFPYSASHILEAHSTLPLYTPFLTPERAEQTKRSLIEGACSNIGIRLGTNYYKSRNPPSLKFCLSCARKDQETLGEAYWHRVHHAPGVIMCPVHHEILRIAQSFPNTWRSSMERFGFYSAESQIKDQHQIRVDRSVSCKALSEIADDVFWLLTKNKSNPGLFALADFYRKELSVRKLATTVSRCVYNERLHEAFKNQFPEPFLKTLGVNLERHVRRSWLLRLVHQRGMQNPLCHIVMIRFLGFTPQEVFALVMATQRSKSIEKYFCLNPVCPCSGKRVIPEFLIKKKQPRAIFRCPKCGFAYARHLPLTDKDELKPASVIDEGPRWNSELKAMWIREDVSMEEMKCILQACYKKIKKRAMSFGLRFPRKGNRHKNNPRKQALRDGRAASVNQTRQKHRERWLSMRKSNPRATRTELKRLLVTSYDWLRRYDKVWFNKHKPPWKRSRLTFARANWAPLDRLLSKTVKKTVGRLLAEDKAQFPSPITVRRIASETEGFPLKTFRDMRRWLPKTSMAISKLIDHPDSLTRRRAAWALNLQALPEGWSFTSLKLRLGFWESRRRISATTAKIVENVVSTLLERLG